MPTTSPNPVLAEPRSTRTAWTITDSPIGPLLLTSDGQALTRVLMDPFPPPGTEWTEGSGDAVLDTAVAELDDYFAGRRSEFTGALAPAGTAFQRRVWAALLTIPYGQTTTYGAVAAQIGAPGQARAVGAASGANPISIIIPCHRVIGANGSLTGYAGGLPRKAELLRRESGLAL